MKNLDQFVVWWSGKKNNYDGGFGAQCVDIVKQWEADNGWPVVKGNAIQVPNNAPKDFYQYVRIGIGQIPSPGDIVVFNLAMPYGHIGICTQADSGSVTCFEQNNPTGSSCRIVNHPGYRNVIGWLKPKGGRIMSDDQWKDLLWRVLHHTWRSHHRYSFPDDNSIRAERDQFIEEYKRGNQWVFSSLIDKWQRGE